ncbi:putative ammonium transporter 3 isoform X2 [Ornithodoros turicata]|uniref:putative ammonium transporter 3 isoform X2 n=1 Tax=Ornithodoros turicata TaxID=34597 RepID=UPI0031390A70
MLIFQKTGFFKGSASTQGNNKGESPEAKPRTIGPEKCLMRTGIVASVAVLTIMGYVLIAPAFSRFAGKEDNVCRTRACLLYAYYLERSLNKTADPCDNFYNFVCGFWKTPRKGLTSVGEVLYNHVVKGITSKALNHDASGLSRATFKAAIMYMDCLAAYRDAEGNANTLKDFMQANHLSWPSPEPEGVHPLDVLVSLATRWHIEFLFKVALHKAGEKQFVLIYPGFNAHEFTHQNTEPDNFHQYVELHAKLFGSAKAVSAEQLLETRILVLQKLAPLLGKGYGLLESGFVSRKNEVNILVKNATTVLFGGFIFWIMGYGLSFDKMKNPYFSFGQFFTHADESHMGQRYSRFVFQLAYATTCTTLVSGAMAERTKFTSYCVLSTLNTLIYCIPAGWLWNKDGFLASMGAVDIGGSGIVHLLGGCVGLVSSIVLGPRLGRYDRGTDTLPLGNPSVALLGLFMLWWGWLGFSAGSTMGIVRNKWKYSARASVTTILASMTGGFVGMAMSFVLKKGKHDVSWLMNSVMGSLVAISGGAPIFRPWAALVVGAVAALLTLASIPILDRIGIDDPTGTFASHGVCGLWGLLSIGLFPERDSLLDYTHGRSGLFVGGDWRLLAIQAMAGGCIMAWAIVISAITLLAVKYTIGLRMTAEEEILGPDLVDHDIVHDYNSPFLKALQEQRTIVNGESKMCLINALN